MRKITGSNCLLLLKLFYGSDGYIKWNFDTSKWINMNLSQKWINFYPKCTKLDQMGPIYSVRIGRKGTKWDRKDQIGQSKFKKLLENGPERLYFHLIILANRKTSKIFVKLQSYLKNLILLSSKFLFLFQKLSVLVSI